MSLALLLLGLLTCECDWPARDATVATIDDLLNSPSEAEPTRAIELTACPDKALAVTHPCTWEI